MTNPSNYCEDCGGPCRVAHITGIPGPRVSSPSRIFNGNVVGKRLTDKKIAEYEAQGFYSKGLLHLPNPTKTGPRCQICQGTHNVRRLQYNYLPRDGWYCELCLEKIRESRKREKELASRVRKAMKEDYI